MARLRTAPVFADQQITVLAIESVEFQSEISNNFCHLTASVEPVAVVVKNRDKTYAVDMDARLVSIDTFSL